MLTAVDHDAYPLAWRDAGSGPLALFLHGLGGSRISWDPQLEALGHLRRCVAWDMPGYGASSGLPTSLEELADAAAALLKELGADRADVVGLSMGGMVAQHLALRHPELVRTLALLDTSPAFGIDGTTREEWLAARLTPLDHGRTPADSAAVVIGSIVGPSCPPTARDEAVAAMRRIPGDALRAACHALVEHDVRSRLHEITAATCVIVGADDAETPLEYAEQLRDGIPGATLRVLPHCGHLSNIECPEPVNDLLADLWASPGSEDM